MAKRSFFFLQHGWLIFGNSCLFVANYACYKNANRLNASTSKGESSIELYPKGSTMSSCNAHRIQLKSFQREPNLFLRTRGSGSKPGNLRFICSFGCRLWLKYEQIQ